MVLSNFQDQALMRHVTRALSSLPSSLAQLVYLASLRDAYTGSYLHEGWITLATPEQVNGALLRLHLKTFDELLGCSLEGLCEELRAHFEMLGASGRKVVELWLELEPYREMMPRGCSPLQRALFISQLKAALKVLACSPDLAVLGERLSSPPLRPVQPPPLHLDN